MQTGFVYLGATHSLTGEGLLPARRALSCIIMIQQGIKESKYDPSPCGAYGAVIYSNEARLKERHRAPCCPDGDTDQWASQGRAKVCGMS